MDSTHGLSEYEAQQEHPQTNYHSTDIHRVFSSACVQVWEKQLTEHDVETNEVKVLGIIATIVVHAHTEGDGKLTLVSVSAQTPEGLYTENTQAFSVGFRQYWDTIDRAYVTEIFDVLESFRNG